MRFYLERRERAILGDFSTAPARRAARGRGKWASCGKLFLTLFWIAFIVYSYPYTKVEDSIQAGADAQHRRPQGRETRLLGWRRIGGADATVRPPGPVRRRDRTTREKVG